MIHSSACHCSVESAAQASCVSWSADHDETILVPARDGKPQDNSQHCLTAVTQADEAADAIIQYRCTNNGQKTL